jgi:cyclopropane-fatty-acyl-phospholipid synthase
MNTISNIHPGLPTPSRLPRSAKAVIRLLVRMPVGRLDLELPNGARHQLGGLHPGAQDLHAAIVVKDWVVFQLALKSGDIGFAQSYIDGQWQTPDLAALLRLMLANRDHLEKVVYGTWWGAAWYRIRHWMNRNSKVGSERNIHAHYDLGNDFYRLWLDPGMSYSSAWFKGNLKGDLLAAQNAKMALALAQAEVGPGTRLLEVGCGWGGLAEMAAGSLGAQVKGITLSKAQLQWAQERIARVGLSDRVELSYQDYRDLPNAHAAQPFDAIVSIEMFEAVGQAYWESYFSMVKQCLKSSGKACIQTITIRDDLFERYRQSTDFIQQYIFPGGLLPSAKEFGQAVNRAGLKVVHRMAMGQDYAETLRRWRESFMSQAEPVAQQGFDQKFVRTWEFYLAYCEAAFDDGATNVYQFTLSHA